MRDDSWYRESLSILKNHVERDNSQDEKKHNIKKISDILALKEAEDDKTNEDQEINCDTEKNSNHCDICDKVFITKKTLVKHRKIHNPGKHECSICQKVFPLKGYLKRHQELHKGKKHECDICGWKFVMLDHLKCHRRTHTGEKPYACRHCPKTFIQTGSRYSHEIRHFKKRYKCEYCEKSYYAVTQYNYHLKREHVKEIESKIEKIHKTT